MSFEIIDEIKEIETFAVGSKIRELERLQENYGRGRWRKCKGISSVKMKTDNSICLVELHWYEATGIGKKEIKIKYFLD